VSIGERAAVTSPQPVRARSTLEHWAWLACLLAASCALAWVIHSVAYLPTNDGPEHILSGHIENHFNDPGTHYADHLIPAAQYAGRGFALVYRPLERVLGWRSAARVTLSFATLLGAWSFVWLTVCLDPRRRWAALLGFAFAIPWTLYMGFFPFVIGLHFGLLIVAFVVSRAIDRLPVRLALAAAFSLQTHLHMFSALMTACVVTLVLVWRRPRLDQAREAFRCVAMAVPVLVVAAFTAWDASHFRWSGASTSTHWGTLAERLATLPRLIAPGPMWKGLLAVCIIGAGIAGAAMRIRRGRAHRDEKALAVAAALLLGAGIVSPLSVPGLPYFQYFNSRFLALGVVLAMALIGVEALTSPRWRAVVAASVVMLTGASLHATWRLHHQMENGCSDALSGLSQPVHRTGIAVSLSLDRCCGLPCEPEKSDVPYLAALTHMAALYATEHGGTLSTFFLGNAAVHAFLPRPSDDDLPMLDVHPPAANMLADPRMRQVVLAYYGEHAAFYESFLVFGARSQDIERVLSRGFAPRWRQGSFLLAEFHGCPVTLKLVRPPAFGAVAVSHAFWPLTESVWSASFPMSPGEGDGVRKIELPHAGCGDVWIRAEWTGKGTGRATCRGAMPDGRMVIRATPSGAEVPCQLVTAGTSAAE
jgi:hypothetical protein